MNENNNYTNYRDPRIRKVLFILIPIVIIVLILTNSFTIIPAGHTGVVVNLGKVTNNVLQEGVHFKVPFIQEIIRIDNRIVKLEVETEAFSRDLQTVNTTLAINYRVDTAKSNSIYKNIGANYEAILVIPAVNEVLKATTANYTAEESVTNRALISEGLVAGLNKKLNDIGLYITDVILSILTSVRLLSTLLRKNRSLSNSCSRLRPKSRLPSLTPRRRQRLSESAPRPKRGPTVQSAIPFPT